MIDKYAKLNSLSKRNRVVLEIGCGQKRRLDESITIDKHDSPAVDIVADLNDGLPFLEMETVDEIHSTHFLEHIIDFESMMNEAYRVLKKGGKFAGSVPHFSNPLYYSDYSHKHFFGLYTFAYFSKSRYFEREVPNFYNSVNFKIISIKLLFFSRRGEGKIASLLTKFINKSKKRKEFYEYYLSDLINCYEIRFELQK